MEQYARVIIQFAKVSAIDRLFTYKIPQHMTDTIEVGMRVKVPFGPRSTPQLAYVLEVLDANPDENQGYKIKSIQGILEPQPILSPQQLKLAQYLVTYYGATWAAAIDTVLPPALGDKGLVYKPQTIQYVKLLLNRVDVLAYIEANNHKKTFTKQKLVLEMLLEQSPRVMGQVLGQDVTKSTLQTLAKNGLILIETTEEAHVFDTVCESAFKVLNEEQLAAKNHIADCLQEERPRTILLQGVTGSGKTEVFLYAIWEVIRRGESAIVLVPEIALTKQTLDRFKERFGNRVALTHSRMTPRERQQLYMMAKEGKVQVVIGPRSAVFMPLPHLKLIVVDEEHEQTYKSETSPKYHAAEVAKYRMSLMQGVVLLASATPSLETYYLSQIGEIDTVKLTQRIGGATMPEVMLVDMREELRQGNNAVISRALYEEIAKTVEEGSQVMLLLNRRGHSTFINCRSCGHVVKCNHCDITMTYHLYNKSLECHYCGARSPIPETCPSCGSTHIRFFGNGTEKVEEYLQTYFGMYGVARMDMDTTSGKYGHERVLEAFRKGENQILVGTQMIAKGHDFPNVTLVGIIAADMSLYMEDFRSEERTFQLLTQTLGRAGRGQRKGKVVIQTYNPEHNVLQRVKHFQQETFYEEELGHRQNMNYPPYTHVFTVTMSGKNEKEVIAKMQLLGQYFNYYNRKKLFRLIGPTAAIIGKVADEYRWKFLIIGESRETLLMYGKYCLEKFTKREKIDLVKIGWDIDPLTML
ncbi:MAG: replication restart helicase PriA [Cellulosilyticaceae bacterium]